MQVQLCEWRQFLEFLDKRARVFEFNVNMFEGVEGCLKIVKTKLENQRKLN